MWALMAPLTSCLTFLILAHSFFLDGLAILHDGVNLNPCMTISDLALLQLPFVTAFPRAFGTWCIFLLLLTPLQRQDVRVMMRCCRDAIYTIL